MIPQKSSILQEQDLQNQKITQFIQIADENISSSVSLLGNSEIDKRFSNLYQKYSRKHIAQYALTVGSTSDFIKSRKSVSNSKKNRGQKNSLSFNKTLYTINKTLCSCGRDPHFNNTTGVVDIKETSTTRRLKGLKSCGNNSACPVCASKLSAIRGNQLKELMNAGRKNGRSYMMVVSTIPHKAGEKLEITLNQVIDMSSYIFNSRKYKDFKEITKCRFVHGGLENMVSFKNGKVDWHPHKNYLLDFDISIAEVVAILGLKSELDLRLYISKMMTSLGQRYLKNQKIKKTLLVPYIEKEPKSNKTHIKGGVSASLEFDDGYITKWGLDAEMTAGIYKDGRFSESFHPFILLDFINQENQEITEKQKHQCIMAFQEFVVASKGKWWFYFGKGAIAYYNEHYGTKLKVKKDEEEVLTLEDDGELVHSMTREEWSDFKPTPKKVGYALSLPTRRDVLDYIYTEIEKNRIKKIEDLERDVLDFIFIETG